MQAIKNGDFFPAGRILYGAGANGKDFKATPMNCYVLPSPEDNIESIYKVNAQMARTFSYGGGCGVAIDKLRPANAKVNNSAKTTSGAVSFLELFNATGSIIGQNGRRSAIMVGIGCKHPDIDEFLHIKETNHKLESMNISIKFTDDFFDAVISNKEWECSFKVKETGELITKKINAREFFKKFCKVNYDYGDPGAIFIDAVQKNHLLSAYDYNIEISNPCSEFMGKAYTACCLGSINLYNCIEDKFTSKAHLNKKKLAYLTSLGVIALNDVLDYAYDKQPLPENKEAITDWRNIGLGFFGLADALIALGITYGSQKSIDFADEVSSLMMEVAIDTSNDIAITKGCFGKFKAENTLQSPIVKKLEPSIQECIKEYGLRNGSLISVAPTGSLALLAGGLCGGIEPLFKVSYERTTHALEANAKSQTFKVFPLSIRELLKYHGLLDKNLSNEEIKKHFPFIVEAQDINPMKRIKVQQAVQQNIDNAISSTINLPETATVEDIYNIYIEAWEAGLKGITIFRDNCKRLSILNPKNKSEDLEKNSMYGNILPVKRDIVGGLPSITYRKQSACSKLYVTITFKDDLPFEVFASITGGCSANIATIVRLTSLALRCGIKPEKIVEELKQQKCPACQTLRKQGRNDIALSCGNAIGDCLREALKVKINKTNVTKENTSTDKSRTTMKCPDCGGEIHAEGKCIACSNCGWSKCE